MFEVPGPPLKPATDEHTSYWHIPFGAQRRNTHIIKRGPPPRRRDRERERERERERFARGPIVTSADLIDFQIFQIISFISKLNPPRSITYFPSLLSPNPSSSRRAEKGRSDGTAASVRGCACSCGDRSDRTAASVRRLCVQLRRFSLPLVPHPPTLSPVCRPEWVEKLN